MLVLWQDSEATFYSFHMMMLLSSANHVVFIDMQQYYINNKNTIA